MSLIVTGGGRCCDETSPYVKATVIERLSQVDLNWDPGLWDGIQGSSTSVDALDSVVYVCEGRCDLCELPSHV